MSPQTILIHSPLHSPLQFDRMSMPSTCTLQNDVSGNMAIEVKNTSIPNLLLYIQEPEYTQLVTALISQSLKSIRSSFFSNDSEGTVDITTHIAEKIYQTSLYDRLMVFFVLLNVDVGLKDAVMNLDGGFNTAKLTRFMIDLKRSLIPQFYVNERVSATAFVESCIDTYIVS